ncbi:MAG TPA: hypothetical protein VEA37_14940, partial [Flavobacterium sp.]|nr:hypothetical protein [Flavobacterium sp.]
MTEDKQNLETKVENSNPAPSDRFWQKKNIYLPVAALLALVIFMAGVSVGQSNSLGSIGLKVLNQSSGELGSVDYSTLWKALKVVSTKYVDKPVDQQKLMYGAVAGMLNALDDPH